MPSFLPNESSTAKRNAEVALYQDDGQTATATTTIYVGTKAKRKLSGLTATLAGITVSYIAVGVLGNTYTLALTADGAGTGSFTNSGTNYTFHYANGVTTAANFVAAIAAVFGVAGSYTGSNTLAAGDATAALKLAGGVDNNIFVRQGSSADYVAAAGTWTQVTVATVARAGSWLYRFTQAELNHQGGETALLVTKSPDFAYLDLATKTTHCDTIVYDKLAVGSSYIANPNGQSTTIQFVNLGGGHSLDESAYPALVYNYTSGATTVKNFEDDVVASTKLGVKQYGTWTAVLANPADTFAAAAFVAGISYADRGYSFPMRMGDFDCVGDGTDAYGDVIRDIRASGCGDLHNFTTGTLVAKSDDGLKTRRTFTCDSSGRTTSKGDLTP